MPVDAPPLPDTKIINFEDAAERRIKEARDQEKTELPLPFTKTKRVKAIQEALNIPPLDVQEQKQKKRAQLDAFYTTRQQEVLAEGEGFLDRHKANIDYYSSQRSQETLSLTEQIKRKTLLATVGRKSKDIASYEAVLQKNNFFSAELYTKDGFQNLIEFTHTTSAEEAEKGLQRIQMLLGVIPDSNMIHSKEFMGYISKLGKIDDNQFTATAQTLNTYTFLSELLPSYDVYNVTELKKGGSGLRSNAKAVLAMIAGGEIPLSYKQRLDAAQKMYLLSGSSVPLIHANGQFDVLPKWGIDGEHAIANVLHNQITNPRYDKLVTLAEELATANTDGSIGLKIGTNLATITAAMEQGKTDMLLTLVQHGVPLDEKTINIGVTIDALGEVASDSTLAERIHVLTTIDSYPYTGGDFLLHKHETREEGLAEVGVIFNFLKEKSPQFYQDPQTLGIVQPGYIDTFEAMRYLDKRMYSSGGEIREKLGAIRHLTRYKFSADQKQQTIEQILQLPEDAKIFTNNVDFSDMKNQFLAWTKGNTSLTNKFFLGEQGLQILDENILIRESNLTLEEFLTYSQQILAIENVAEDLAQAVRFFENLSPEYRQIFSKHGVNAQELTKNGTFSKEALRFFARNGNADELREVLSDAYIQSFDIGTRQSLDILRRFPDNKQVAQFLLRGDGEFPDKYITAGAFTIAFYEDLGSVDPAILTHFETEIKNLVQGQSEAVQSFWDHYFDIPDSSLRGILLKTKNNLLEKGLLTKEQLVRYITIAQKIEESPSQEIQRSKDVLIAQIIETENPEQAYEKINEIFIKNNLPTIGKAFRVFETLYPPDKVDKIVREHNFPPVLVSASYERGEYSRRYDIIYRDLLKAHIGSGNRSLRDFVSFLETGIPLFDKVLANETLTDDELKRASVSLRKLQRLQENSVFGRETPLQVQIDTEEIDTPEKLQEGLRILSESLGVKENQTIQTRVEQMFLRPLKGTFAEFGGVHTLSDIPRIMKETKHAAEERNLTLYAQSMQDGEDRFIQIKEGDLIKHHRVDMDVILNGGIVSREFLGGSADSDSTPFGTDFTMVTKEDAENGFEKAYSNSATSYGEIALVIRDRGQLQKTVIGQPAHFEGGKYEVYNTAIADKERHMDVRTGLPSTEIDYIICADTTMIDTIAFSVAKQGMYIPIVDTKGKVLFTPEQYYLYRSAFDGIAEYEGKALRVVRTNERDPNYAQVQELIPLIEQNMERISQLSHEVRTQIESAIKEEGIVLADKYSLDITEGLLEDTGSTARFTDVPGSEPDFDLVLSVDEQKIKRAYQIGNNLVAALNPVKNESHSDNEGGYQVRAFGSAIDGRQVDVDVAIVSKAGVRTFGSHQAAEQKLLWIKEHKGEEVYLEVLANIVLAKKLLKEIGVYKKDQGGFAGIGTENWILAHGGNVARAFESFWESAHHNGNIVSLDQFKKRYPIRDAGINLKLGKHGNFVDMLSSDRYSKIVTMIGAYLGKTEQTAQIAA